MFGSFILVLLFGVSVVFALGTTAIIWALVVMGPKLLSTLSSQVFSVGVTEILIAVPLFVTMGTLLAESGVADEMYGVAYDWSGGIRGGLAMGTVGMGAIMAACVGEVASSGMTLGVVATPPMLKRSYNKSLAWGSTAAAACLGILIPPSIPMIIYATIAKVSVGKMFFGGVFPGLLLVLFYIAYIGIRAALQPDIAPPVPVEERVSLAVKLKKTRHLLAPVLLILLVLGSIYMGIATPTESASVGALGALIIVVVYRRFTWQMFSRALYKAAQLTAFGIWLLIAAYFFNSAYRTSGAEHFLISILSGLPVSPWVIMLILQLIILLLGMVMDEWAMIALVTPLFVPIITSLGFDLVWFGVVFMVNEQVALLSPPYGFALFVLKSTNPEAVTMEELYRAAFPFVLIQIVGIAICMMVPAIVLWLPNHMHA
jgi:tripartite ATP-independent transporter DctM subunit